MRDPDSFRLIKGKFLVDGRGGAPIEDAALLLKNDKILMAGRRSDVSPPDGAKVLMNDFPDGSILPGLIDVHTHLNYPGDGTHTDDVMSETDDILLMQSILNAHNYLRLGVTTIRDNGAKNHTTLSLREGMGKGLATGPRLVLCGNPITMTGGHMWQMGGEADGVNEVVKGVRRLVNLGADYIKVAVTGGTTHGTYPNLPAYGVDELRAIVNEAHKFGKLVAGHAHASDGIINALDAGIDMLIHCSWMEPDGTLKYREDIVDRIAESGTWVNPTLYQVTGAGQEILLKKSEEFGLTHEEEVRLEGLKRLYPQHITHVGKMAEAGAKLVTGSDCGWGDMPFDRIYREMELFVDSGMTNMEAITTATSKAAQSLGLQDLIGTLEPGKEADVAVFGGAPHSKVSDISNILAVFQGGEQVL